MNRTSLPRHGISRFGAAAYGSALLVFVLAGWADELGSGRWSEKQAQDWREKTGWLAGCDFLPSTSINQLEMFQAETFDLATLDRELGWAQSLGFNALRVYLQDLLW